ncbi:MAG: thiamine-phosphate kinase [Spirochaetota bacterium]|nr:thiamine-phosphate kinase [Spirochaetota bacterium]
MEHSEFQFIEQIRDRFKFNSFAERGIGDDCAVIPFSAQESYIITTDNLVENIHFTLKTTSFKSLGWKSIAVNFSDIASMGGIPKYIFISIAIPKKISAHNIYYFYDGVEQIIKQYGVKLLGGDTTGSIKHLFISITAIGIAKTNKILYRSGAKENDYVYVTGSLGDSSVGLSLINKNSTTEDINKKILIDKHLSPKPRVNEMIYLNAKYTIHSSIDISDGLSSDLSHILNESKVGAEIEWNKIPVSNELNNVVSKGNIEDYVLNGGEDYEILFTSPVKVNTEEFQKEMNCPLSRIGKITTSDGLILLKDNSKKLITPKGFNHFK